MRDVGIGNHEEEHEEPSLCSALLYRFVELFCVEIVRG
jgi:hypothetical protein